MRKSCQIILFLVALTGSIVNAGTRHSGLPNHLSIPDSEQTDHFLLNAGKLPVAETFLHAPGIYHIADQSEYITCIKISAEGTLLKEGFWSGIYRPVHIEETRHVCLASLVEIIFPFHGFW